MLVDVSEVPDDLPPTEYKTALMLRKHSRLRTVEVAELVGITERQARRVLAVLIERGLASRVTRGLYRADTSSDRAYMSGRVVSKQTMEQVYLLPVGATHLQSGGFHPPERDEKEETVARDDYLSEGDDLGGSGLIEPRETSAHRAKRRYKVPENHRETPREQWTMDYVTKEFRLRLQKAKPLTLDNWRTAGVIGLGTGGNRMLLALKKWQFEYGITPQETALLVDRFFDDPAQVARIDNDVPAYRIFLEYLKRNVDGLRKRNDDPEFDEWINSQEIHL